LQRISRFIFYVVVVVKRHEQLLDGLDDSREYVVLMGGTRAARDAGLALEQGA
jgi:hypothetical protein